MTDATGTPTVLIVDDEERVANTYALRLGEGYDTAVALSGEDALQMVDETVDVVLLDRRMPGMSGEAVLEEIRARGLECRVVMVTAVDPGFDIAEMDIDDYVVKPIDKSELRDVVDRALTVAEYNQQMQELSALKLKRNVLEVELHDTELEESETYTSLVEQIAQLESELDAMEADLDLEQIDLFL